jgi:hypothetical protein
MAIRKRVNEVLGDWCGVTPDDQTIALEVLWTSTRNNPDRPHNGIDFQPDGVQDLRDMLVEEFKKPGTERKRVSVLKAGHFKPNGDIETVNDLVRAVVVCPNLKPME